MEHKTNGDGTLWQSGMLSSVYTQPNLHHLADCGRRASFPVHSLDGAHKLVGNYVPSLHYVKLFDATTAARCRQGGIDHRAGTIRISRPTYASGVMAQWSIRWAQCTLAVYVHTSVSSAPRPTVSVSQSAG